MKNRSYAPLGEAEMEMLQHVWELKRASVTQVHERVLGERDVAYTTVMSILKKLADKGYLNYERDGNAYVYSPARSPEEVRSSVLSTIVKRVFRGSPAALVQTLTRQEDLSDEERDQIRGLIEALERSERERSGQDGGQ